MEAQICLLFARVVAVMAAVTEVTKVKEETRVVGKEATRVAEATMVWW